MLRFAIVARLVLTTVLLACGCGSAGRAEAERARVQATKDPASLFFGGKGGGKVVFDTEFSHAESPVSEGGAFKHTGLDWTKVVSADGIAYGTQTGTGGYDDSYAYLSGFAPDQAASGVIHRIANVDASCTHEVEILLRWSDAEHDAHGYECNLAFDGSYAEIVRWNGPFGKYDYLGRGSVPDGVHDGDVLTASIVGDEITLSVNGKVVVQAHDATFKTGNPGIGFWRGGKCGTPGDYGFKRFTAGVR